MSAPTLEGTTSRLPAEGLTENLGSRVTRIETQIESLATKEDLEKLKVWILRGVAATGLAILAIAFGALFREIAGQFFTPQSSLSSGAACSSALAPYIPSVQQYQAGAGYAVRQTRSHSALSA